MAAFNDHIYRNYSPGQRSIFYRQHLENVRKQDMRRLVERWLGRNTKSG